MYHQLFLAILLAFLFCTLSGCSRTEPEKACKVIVKFTTMEVCGHRSKISASKVEAALDQSKDRHARKLPDEKVMTDNSSDSFKHQLSLLIVDDMCSPPVLMRTVQDCASKCGDQVMKDPDMEKEETQTCFNGVVDNILSNELLLAEEAAKAKNEKDEEMQNFFGTAEKKYEAQRSSFMLDRFLSSKEDPPAVVLAPKKPLNEASIHGPSPIHALVEEGVRDYYGNVLVPDGKRLRRHMD